jgi:hypothetical protein
LLGHQFVLVGQRIWVRRADVRELAISATLGH